MILNTSLIFIILIAGIKAYAQATIDTKALEKIAQSCGMVEGGIRAMKPVESDSFYSSVVSRFEQLNFIYLALKALFTIFCINNQFRIFYGNGIYQNSNWCILRADWLGPIGDMIC